MILLPYQRRIRFAGVRTGYRIEVKNTMTTPSSTQVTPDRMLMPHEVGPKVAKEGLHSLLSHYCSISEKRLDYGQLLSMARYELSKYGLPPAKVREIAPVYARTLKMHLEQNGYQTLDPTFKEEM